MIAPWPKVLDVLRAHALHHGVQLPENPHADGRWHSCTLIERESLARGAYLLLTDLLIALYSRLDGTPVEVWRHDDQRLPTLALAHRIDGARRSCPPSMVVATCVTSTTASKEPAIVPLESSSRLEVPAPQGISGGIQHSKRPAVELQRATDFLEAILAGGPVRVVEVRALALHARVKWGTLRRAAEALPVCRIKEGFAGEGAWWWGRATVLSPNTRCSTYERPR
jgi:hypothetical protein